METPKKDVLDGITIKIATEPNDLDLLRTLLFADYLEARVSQTGVNWNYLHMRAYHEHMMKTNSAFAVLAQDAQGIPVGALYAVYTSAHGCDPMNMWCTEAGWYVDPRYRGAGLGWKLMDFAEDHARGTATVFTMGLVYKDGVAAEKKIEAMKARGYVPALIKFVKPLLPKGG